ncbi:MAG TPA: efflux RND transporter periplasmic adaptor subunit [Verrucomicrobiae bacterium]
MNPRRFPIFLYLVTAGYGLLLGCSKPPGNTFQGYVEGEYVYVGAPLSGSLLNLQVSRGQLVTNQQPLFELERAAEASALDQAAKNRDQAQSSAQLSQITLQRRKELRAGADGVVSAEELDRAQSERDTAVALVAAQQAAWEKAKWAFDQKQQAAPTNAVVHDTLYRPGEWVAAGAPVLSLLPPANIKIRFFVPQTSLAKIQVGHPVQVHFDGASHGYLATIDYVSTAAEFTPPVIFSRETRANLVYLVEARPAATEATDFHPGQPVDVALP